jgi:hypothetical protein
MNEIEMLWANYNMITQNCFFEDPTLYKEICRQIQQQIINQIKENTI